VTPVVIDLPGTLAIGGVERTFHLVGPDTPPTSLMLVLHGSNSNARQTRALSGHTFDKLALRDVLVAYPESHDGLWNDARIGTRSHARELGIDDVAYLTALVTHLTETYAVSPDRVFALGFSNGGQMVIRVVLQAPDLIRGAGLIGSCMPTPGNTLAEMADLDQRRPMPMLTIHGTKDPIVPFQGGTASLWGFRPRGEVMSAPDTARFFARRNGVKSNPLNHRVTSGRLGATVTAYRDDGHVSVDFYAIEKGGHTIPNRDHRAPFILGRTARDLDAGELARDFFGLAPD
jgi:polyhydroxybutyrate depolymerase